MKNIDIEKCKRDGFKGCYYDACGYGEFKGKVIKIKNGHYLFEKIFVEWEYGGNVYESKEDHVWIFDTKALEKEKIKIGDCVAFFGVVEPYTRKNGTYELGITDVDLVYKIEDYKLPTDEELFEQAMNDLRCETCLYTDHCDRVFCLLSN